MGPADSRRIPRVPRYSGYGLQRRSLREWGSHPLRPGFPARHTSLMRRKAPALQPRGCRNIRGLGSSPVARRYWGNHSYFLFLRVLRCFSSPRSPSPYEGECHVFNMTGCPIRKSADQRPFAPPRGFSQLITSFIASESQGIRHVPFFPFTSPRTGVPCGWIYFRLPPYRAGCLYCHTMS